MIVDLELSCRLPTSKVPGQPHLVEALQLFQRGQPRDELEARAVVLLDEVAVLVVLIT